MMNFIDLLNNEITQNIVLQPINFLDNEIALDIVLLPTKINVNVPNEESEGCIKDSCKIEVGCGESFGVKNLFSELTDDWQRKIARLNLGIGDEGALLWGNLQGNLANQIDLVKFIKDTSGADTNEIINLLNLKLKYWTSQIENKIESLASNIISIEVIPLYTTSDLTPVDVLLTWEYDLPVQAQAVNGIIIDPEVRNYIFTNVEDTLFIRLSYYYNNVWLSRNIVFDVASPVYYGTSDNYRDNNYTIGNVCKINAGENLYLYIMSKNELDLSVNGIIGGFEKVGVTNIASNRYIIYKSLHPNLGETTIRMYDKE